MLALDLGTGTTEEFWKYGGEGGSLQSMACSANSTDRGLVEACHTY